MGEIESVVVCKRVIEQLSSGRKVFKFLKFVDEFKNIFDLFLKEKKHGFFVFLVELVGKVCGFFYYLLDNVVWIANIGMIKKFVFKNVKWKRIKDLFTLVKNWASLIKSLLVWYRSIMQEKKIIEELDKIG